MFGCEREKRKKALVCFWCPRWVIWVLPQWNHRSTDSHWRLWKRHSAAFKHSVSEHVRLCVVFAQGIYFLSSVTDGSCSELALNLVKEAGRISQPITSCEYLIVTP